MRSVHAQHLAQDGPRVLGDAKARETARHALANFYPAAYPSDMRLFFFMPFQHSEDLGDQDFCCTLFASLGNRDNDKYANEHRDIVARFGRFPHRNEVLGATQHGRGDRLPQDGEALRAMRKDPHAEEAAQRPSRSMATNTAHVPFETRPYGPLLRVRMVRYRFGQ